MENTLWLLKHQNHLMIGLMVFLVFCFFLSMIQSQIKSKQIAQQRQAIVETFPPDIQDQVKAWSFPMVQALHEQKITIEEGKAVFNRKFMLGMPVMCVEMLWGRPHDIDTKVSGRGTTTVWKWFGRRNGRRIISKKVIFLDGRIESWET